jgi:hypothetical protein
MGSDRMDTKKVSVAINIDTGKVFLRIDEDTD